jgi:hypothetical protein
MFMLDRAKGRIKSSGYEAVPIALCDSLLWMMIVAEVGWSFAPSFSWIQGISVSLSYGGLYHCRGTCNTEA